MVYQGSGEGFRAGRCPAAGRMAWSLAPQGRALRSRSVQGQKGLFSGDPKGGWSQHRAPPQPSRSLPLEAGRMEVPCPALCFPRFPVLAGPGGQACRISRGLEHRRPTGAPGRRPPLPSRRRQNDAARCFLLPLPGLAGSRMYGARHLERQGAPLVYQAEGHSFQVGAGETARAKPARCFFIPLTTFAGPRE